MTDRTRSQGGPAPTCVDMMKHDTLRLVEAMRQ